MRLTSESYTSSLCVCVCDEFVALLFFMTGFPGGVAQQKKKKGGGIERENHKDPSSPHMDFPQTFSNGSDMDNTVVFVV